MNQVRSEALVALVKEYFRRVGMGDPTIAELFDENVEISFPKFGTRSGKSAVGVLAQGLFAQVQSLSHDQNRFEFVQEDNTVVVEGWETGVLKDGTAFPVNTLSQGRFCNVFRFRGNLISQLHIYGDPDFAGKDTQRFYWGK